MQANQVRDASQILHCICTASQIHQCICTASQILHCICTVGRQLSAQNRNTNKAVYRPSQASGGPNTQLIHNTYNYTTTQLIHNTNNYTTTHTHTHTHHSHTKRHSMHEGSCHSPSCMGTFLGGRLHLLRRLLHSTAQHSTAWHVSV